MAELEECPFCGEQKLLELRTVERDDKPQCKWTAEVNCLRCFASARTHGFFWTKKEAEKEAIAAWNRRPAPENKALTCEVIRT